MGKSGLHLHRDGTVVFPRLDPATATSDGSSLRAVEGLPMPVLNPETMLLLHLRRR